MDYKVGDSAPVPGMMAYKKKDEQLDEYAARGGAKKKKPKQANKENVEKRDSKEASPAAAAATAGASGKKTKFVPLFDKDGKAGSIMLPGRNPCQCQAVKHKLINNCMHCGKIVCAQEGSGPCHFCGNLVCTKEEQEVLDRQSRKSEQLLRRIAGGDSRAEYKDGSSKKEEQQRKAIESKNMLLEFDATCEKRTKVIDDESDYFNIDSNKWLTPEQREALAKKKEELQASKHRSRLDRKITFDFAGRQVYEDESVPEYKYDEDEKLLKLFKDDQFSVQAEIKRRAEEGGGLVHPDLDAARPVYNEALNYDGKVEAKTGKSTGAALARIQDGALQEMTDQGVCLSMHQPWASLLVIGVKLHEGRTWYSNHRGRLWIHAASKVPTQQEVDQLHNFYRVHSGIQANKFPPQYPTSCLVGCVDVTDVLSQEEYRDKFPDGESNSPYVFICENPQELLIKFPMSGKHKLFQLDSKILKAAQKTVKKKPHERGSGVAGL